MSSRNGLLKLLSSILSLILAIVLIATIPLMVVDYMLAEDNMGITVSLIFDNIEDISELGIATDEGNKTIADVLLWSIKDCPGALFITEKQAASTLVPEFFKELTIHLLTDFRNSLEKSSLDMTYKADDIYRFLERNSNTISELASDSGYNDDVDIKKNKESILKNISDLIGKEGISVGSLLADSSLKDNVDAYMEDAHAFLSEYTLDRAWKAIGILAGILFLVNLGYFGCFLSACGKPTFIIGLAYFLIAVAVRTPILSSNLPIEELPDFIKLPIGYTASVIMDYSSPFLIAGLVLIILSAIGRKKHNN